MIVFFSYQFFLQVKHDIVQGCLPVGHELAAELAAYAVQCESQFFYIYAPGIFCENVSCQIQACGSRDSSSVFSFYKLVRLS